MYLQAFLTHLLTVDLPSLMVLPKRLEISIPPAVTAVAEAAVGRDVVMKAVASAVLQADALENALLAALPLGPQSAAGGVSLPDTFQGELQVRCKVSRPEVLLNFLCDPAVSLLAPYILAMTALSKLNHRGELSGCSSTLLTLMPW